MPARPEPLRKDAMNTKTKRRLAVVTGVIVIVVILVLAFVGGNTAAKSVTVAQAAGGTYENQKIQVSGNVVENSFSTNDNVLSIYDPDADPATQLKVSYDGGVSATFGNDVTAICTGKIGKDGVLQCTELVTKCPSKYENASDALTVSRLLGYGSEVANKPVKVAGVVKDGTLTAAGSGDRFVIVDADTNDELAVSYDGALSDDVQAGSSVVLTGSIGDTGKFTATDVALKS